MLQYLSSTLSVPMQVCRYSWVLLSIFFFSSTVAPKAQQSYGLLTGTWEKKLHKNIFSDDDIQIEFPLPKSASEKKIEVSEPPKLYWTFTEERYCYRDMMSIYLAAYPFELDTAKAEISINGTDFYKILKLQNDEMVLIQIKELFSDTIYFVKAEPKKHPIERFQKLVAQKSLGEIQLDGIYGHHFEENGISMLVRFYPDSTFIYHFSVITSDSLEADVVNFDKITCTTLPVPYDGVFSINIDGSNAYAERDYQDFVIKHILKFSDDKMHIRYLVKGKDQAPDAEVLEFQFYPRRMPYLFEKEP